MYIQYEIWWAGWAFFFYTTTVSHRYQRPRICNWYSKKVVGSKRASKAIVVPNTTTKIWGEKVRPGICKQNFCFFFSTCRHIASRLRILHGQVLRHRHKAKVGWDWFQDWSVNQVVSNQYSQHLAPQKNNPMTGEGRRYYLKTKADGLTTGDISVSTVVIVRHRRCVRLWRRGMRCSRHWRRCRRTDGPVLIPPTAVDRVDRVAASRHGRVSEFSLRWIKTVWIHRRKLYHASHTGNPAMLMIVVGLRRCRWSPLLCMIVRTGVRAHGLTVSPCPSHAQRPGRWIGRLGRLRTRRWRWTMVTRVWARVVMV